MPPWRRHAVQATGNSSAFQSRITGACGSQNLPTMASTISCSGTRLISRKPPAPPEPIRRQSTRLACCWLATPQSAQPHQAASDRQAVKVGVQQFFPHALWRCRDQDGISGPDVIRRHELFKFQGPFSLQAWPEVEGESPEQREPQEANAVLIHGTTSGVGLGGPSAFQISIAAFHDPSACFFHTTTPLVCSVTSL